MVCGDEDIRFADGLQEFEYAFQIVELMVQQLNANLAQKSITLSVTEEAKAML